MNVKWLKRITQTAFALIGLCAMLLVALPAQAAPWDGRRNQFADDAFGVVWTRTDSEAVRGGRTWYWGPQPWFDYAEFYRQSPNGLRTVQYFDKARMEINDPNDRSYQGGVTNGLLVVELVSGNMQLGNDPYDNDYRQPAEVPVAGNPAAQNPNGPTYASFKGLATYSNNAYRDPNRLNERVGATLDKGGNVSFRQDFVDRYPETQIVQYNSVTGHNIPRVFWDFMNQQGRYVEGGVVRNGPVIDWLFAMGLPISDPYWVRAQVGDTERDVLVQLFERRVLTYTPDNPAGYKVEMGNVGQHYFQWRYPQLGQPWAATQPDLQIVYASNVDTGDHWEVYVYDLASQRSARLTSGEHETVAYSYRRSYDASKVRLLTDSRRGNGERRQIYELTVPPLSQEYGQQPGVRRLIYSDGTPIPPSGPYPGYLPGGIADEYNPSVSPDGTKVVFVSTRDGVPQLYLMTADGASPVRLTTDGCLSQVPSWSPDGRSIYWERQCAGGRYTIMAAHLKYNNDGQYGAYAELVDVRELTDQSSDNRFPRISPDGSKVLFTSYRDGNAELYVMNRDGSEQARLTNNAAEDEAGSWSPSGEQIVFASNRDGDYELFVMNAGGANQTQITNNTADDRWALWAQ